MKSAECSTNIYRQISIYAIVCIAFLICVFNPYTLYNSDITQFDLTQTIATLSALFGVFVLISFIMIYALSFVPKRFSNIIAFIFSLMLFSGIVYSFILVSDYGAMDRFILQKSPEKSAWQIVEFISVLAFGVVFIALLLKKLLRLWQIIFITLFIVSGVNAINIMLKRNSYIKVNFDNPQNLTHSAPPPFAIFARTFFLLQNREKYRSNCA